VEKNLSVTDLFLSLYVNCWHIFT